VRTAAVSEADGYRYGRNGGLGITAFEIRPPATTSKDEIAFGFMTWSDSGTLLRVDGDSASGHFVEAQLVCVKLHLHVRPFVCLFDSLFGASNASISWVDEARCL